ncbi:MAG: hypothetical protein JST92_09380 [Deltaproteobacteria bacterium]|nr:hypothetical protein [Deltaproteobacteria bacterium]
MELALQLSRQIAAIEDVSLRARRAAELISSLEPAQAVEALSGLLRLADKRSDPSSAALEGALLALRELIDEPTRERLRKAAQEARAADVSTLLSGAEAARHFDRDKEPWVDKKMRALTLGERKQMARGFDRDRLSRLLTDPDPAVVRHLLDNPRIVERDVLVAASRRPARIAVLEEIFRSRRWAQNRRVRRALALKPYSPPALASGALALLTLPDLREVMNDGNLSPLVRLHAQRLIAHRRGRPEEAPEPPDETELPETSPEVEEAARLEAERLLQGVSLGERVTETQEPKPMELRPVEPRPEVRMVWGHRVPETPKN